MRLGSGFSSAAAFRSELWTAVTLACCATSALGQGIEVGPAVASFGLIDGSPSEVIGRVRDIAVSPSGDVFFTDAIGMRVGWLRAAGTLGGWFGREGDGPEEFISLDAVDVLPDGRVAVGDEGHRRIVFLRPGPDGLTFDGDLRVVGFPRDICPWGDGFLVLSLQDGSVVQHLDQSGAHVDSFGSPLETPFRLAERWRSMTDGYSANGRMLCLPEHNRVIILSTILPEVRAFDIDGHLIWQTELSEYRRTMPTQNPSGSVSMRPDPKSGTTHIGVGAWERDGIVGLQLIEMGLKGPSEGTSEVRFLDLATGNELGRQRPAPRVAAWHDSTFVAWENSPFPRIMRMNGKLRR